MTGVFAKTETGSHSSDTTATFNQPNFLSDCGWGHFSKETLYFGAESVDRASVKVPEYSLRSPMFSKALH